MAMEWSQAASIPSHRGNREEALGQWSWRKRLPLGLARDPAEAPSSTTWANVQGSLAAVEEAGRCF